MTSPKFGSRYYTDPIEAEAAGFIMVKLKELTGEPLTDAKPGDRIIGDLYVNELDSLAAVEVIAGVERRFGIAISEEEAARTQTVGDFVELVAAKIKAGGRH